MMNIKDYMEVIKEQISTDSRYFATDYLLYDYESAHYIQDSISEWADNNTSIYYCDIEKFMAENIDMVNRAIDEFGWDGCGSDLHRAGQMAEFLKNEDTLYNDMGMIIEYCVCSYLLDVDVETIEKGTYSHLLPDDPEKVYEIYELAKEYLEEELIA